MRTLKRRDFLALTGAVTLAVPLRALAQQAQAKLWRIALLTSGNVDPTNETFRNEMRKLGYVEGRHYSIVSFNAPTTEDAPSYAARAVAMGPDMIIASGTPSSVAAKDATKVIPIVFSAGAAFEIGLVTSLDHPGGNITGVSGLTPLLGTRRVQILSDLVPNLRKMAAVLQPGEQSAQAVLQEVLAAGKMLGIEVVSAQVEATVDYEALFASLGRQGVQALLVIGSNGFGPRAQAIANAALRNRLPTIFNTRQFPAAGGLASYGQIAGNNDRRLAHMVGLIIKGTKPGDIPVEQPAEFELVINAKTAHALGLVLPQSVLIQADVIE